MHQERHQGAPRAKAQIDGFALETRSEDVICAFVGNILLRTRGATQGGAGRLKLPFSNRQGTCHPLAFSPTGDQNGYENNPSE